MLDPVATVAGVRYPERILAMLGTALFLWALIFHLRAADWNSDRFWPALRENRRIAVLGILGLGLNVASALVGLLS